MVLYIRDNQEIDRRHVPPTSEAIRGSGGIENVSTKAKEVSTLRGPAQLADLQGALCVPTNNLTSPSSGNHDAYTAAAVVHDTTRTVVVARAIEVTHAQLIIIAKI